MAKLERERERGDQGKGEGSGAVKHNIGNPNHFFFPSFVRHLWLATLLQFAEAAITASLVPL